MSSDLSAVEKSIEEILIDLMAEKVMSMQEYRPHRREDCKPPHRLHVDLGHPELRQRNGASIAMTWKM
jgi:hypothetical protein